MKSSRRAVSAYYNDNDPYLCEWLRNLIAAGHIADGEVDDRNIQNIEPSELRGFDRCHFFAGIGGWELALALAAWPSDQQVWTGSCPCQPFSSAGKRTTTDDDRHLWPEWFRLIKECQPNVLFGEQVEGAVGFGWLDLVCSDLEGAGYAVGSSVLGAHSAGAPHIRQRLWFVADTERIGQQEGRGLEANRRKEPGTQQLCHAGGVGNSNREGSQSGKQGSEATRYGSASIAAGSAGRHGWQSIKWIGCADGKARPVEPGIQPLAHGVSGRVGRLRAYGNSIVPQVAAEFIRAYKESVQ